MGDVALQNRLYVSNRRRTDGLLHGRLTTKCVIVKGRINSASCGS